MTAQPSTLDKLHRLESLYRQGYRSAAIDLTLDKMIALEEARIRCELGAIEVRLQALEQQHGMPSAEFAPRFHAGELGDEADFFEWSACCDMAHHLRQRLQTLESETQ